MVISCCLYHDLDSRFFRITSPPRPLVDSCDKTGYTCTATTLYYCRNKAVADYLKSSGYHNAYTEFQKEAELVCILYYDCFVITAYPCLRIVYPDRV